MKLFAYVITLGWLLSGIDAFAVCSSYSAFMMPSGVASVKGKVEAIDESYFYSPGLTLNFSQLEIVGVAGIQTCKSILVYFSYAQSFADQRSILEDYRRNAVLSMSLGYYLLLGYVDRNGYVNIGNSSATIGVSK